LLFGRVAAGLDAMDTFNEVYVQLSKVPGLCDSIGMDKAM
jgi:hypothetical protein